LRQGLGQSKVTLIGHSWGGALGLLYAHEHPDKVAAVVAVSPVVSTRAGQRAEYDFVLKEASRRQDEEAVAQLRDIGAPPHDSAAEVLAVEHLAERYGAVFHEKPRRMWIMLRAVASGLVTPWEIPRLIRGNQVSLEAMNDELADLDLARSVPGLDVPVVFMLGRHDQHVSAGVAASYFDALRAPAKKVIWFERSAHNAPFEEADRFNATVLSELQAIGAGVADP
jgi:pimeloyl-ACP methyl ester carboxylesterase